MAKKKPRRKKKTRLEKWGEEKNDLTVLTVRNAVAVADWLSDFLKAWDKGKIPCEFVPLGKWLELYETPFGPFSGVIDGLFGQPVEGVSYVDVWANGVKLLKRAQEQPEVYARLVARLDDDEKQEAISIGREFVRALHDERLAGFDVEGSIKDSEMEVMNETFLGADGQFLLRVFVPCMALSRETPGELFRKCREGDLPSIQKLSSIDPEILKDEVIGDITGRLRVRSPGQYRRTIGRAQSAPLKLPGQREAKLLVIGCLDGMLNRPEAKALGITMPEMRDLFDAYMETKSGHKGARDRNLPDTYDGFRRAVHREAEKWKPFFDRVM